MKWQFEITKLATTPTLKTWSQVFWAYKGSGCMGIVTIKQTKNHVGWPAKLFQNYNFVRFFLCGVMLIMGSCVKWLIRMLGNSK
jgi:hypothetical protein